MLKFLQKQGLAKPSLARSLLERNAAEEHEMKWIAATMYGGGADTVRFSLVQPIR